MQDGGVEANSLTKDKNNPIRRRGGAAPTYFLTNHFDRYNLGQNTQFYITIKLT